MKREKRSFEKTGGNIMIAKNNRVRSKDDEKYGGKRKDKGNGKGVGRGKSEGTSKGKSKSKSRIKGKGKVSEGKSKVKGEDQVTGKGKGKRKGKKETVWVNYEYGLWYGKGRMPLGRMMKNRQRHYEG